MSNIYIYVSTLDKTKKSDERIQEVAKCYSETTGIKGNFNKICREERGKPYFPEASHVHFSVSHSGEIWLCAFSQEKIGVDIQEITDCDWVKVANRFFNQQESDFLKEKKKEDFFELWSAKESYVKYTGTGISGNFKEVSVIPMIEEQTTPQICKVNLKKEYQEKYKLYICSDIVSEIRVEYLP